MLSNTPKRLPGLFGEGGPGFYKTVCLFVFFGFFGLFVFQKTLKDVKKDLTVFLMLMYATLGTRRDICFAVQTVSRFNSKPGLAHWEAVKRIFCYLKGTKELWLGYGGVARELVGFADADGSMGEDRRAISGYAFIINGGAVSWSAKRQEIISLSTTESEYIAATYAAKEALWLRQLILQLFGILLPATPLFCDNQSAIALAKEHQYPARTKHINVRFHFIRWIVEDGKLRLIYCPTEEMVAHILTKALVSTKVKHFASKLGLVPL